MESSVNVLDVDPDTYFFYRVSAVDADGNEGDLSCTKAASAPNGGATEISDPCKSAVGWAKSAVPVNLWGSWENFTDKVYIGWDSAPLTWDGNGQPTSYAAQYYVETSIDNAQWYDVPGTPFSHPFNPPDATPIMLTVPVSLTNTVFYFRVKTKFDYDGHEMWSNPAFVQAKTASVAPPPENNILPAPGLVVSKYYPGKIMVGWSTITGATGYKVYRSTLRDSGYSLIKTFNSTVTRFDDTTVEPWTDYWYKVRAMNGTVEGLLSQPEYGNASQF